MRSAAIVLLALSLAACAAGGVFAQATKPPDQTAQRKPATAEDIDKAIDKGVQFLFSRQGETLDPNTSCITPAPHADINGDGRVDVLDREFIDRYWLETDKEACCPSLLRSSRPVPITEISIDKLQKMGMGELSVADLNGDGLLNMTDVELFRQGQPPNRAKSISHGRKR